MKVPEAVAEIALLKALDKTLHYSIPDVLRQRTGPGMRVLVPLGRSEAVGMVLSLAESPADLPSDIQLRPLRTILDESPVLTEELIRLCRWVSSYYFYPVGEVIQAVLQAGTADVPQAGYRLTEAAMKAGDAEDPKGLLRILRGRKCVAIADITSSMPSSRGLKKALADLENAGFIERCVRRSVPGGSGRTRIVRLAGAPDPKLVSRNSNLQALVRLLEASRDGLPIRDIRRMVGNADYWIRKLGSLGVLEIAEQKEPREFSCAQDLPCTPPPELTEDQQEILQRVLPCIRHASFESFMLFGITGSGKTEVYLRLSQAALDQDRGAIVLVPEIALSTQMEALFRHRFGDRLAVWHSALPQGVRNDRRREIFEGKRSVVLGARSAVFMPVNNPGIIIVDEEHDSSYKQDDHLRYNARDVAIMRARMLGIPVVLGSATPSLQTIRHSRLNRYHTLVLPRRIHDRPHPEMEVVDMRREPGRPKVLSARLKSSLLETLESGCQALLFLNRRGFSTCFLCGVCGEALQCTSCSVTLTYHRSDRRLRCHYCGFDTTVPDRCPACGNTSLIPYGFGTERVEAEVRRLLPDARIVRIDRDTVTRAGDLVRFLDSVRSNRADVLIGTQMVAKGHDFPNIALVGVINADTALQLPDFRAGETTVQLLLQVAGRAGRGDTSGRVILQTYNPGHYTLQSVLTMDYEGFCDRELESRSALQYPPFTRFLRFLVTASGEAQACRGAAALAALCRTVAGELRESGRHIAVLGPSPAPLVKLKDRFRRHVFVKTWTNVDLQTFVEEVLRRAAKEPELRRVQTAVDRDPSMNL